MDGLRHRLMTKVAGNGYSPLLRSPRLPPTLLLSPYPPYLHKNSAEHFVEELPHRGGVAKRRREAMGFLVPGIHGKDRLDLAARPGSVGARQIEARELESRRDLLGGEHHRLE